MHHVFTCLLLLTISLPVLPAQVLLDADGPGSTYELITGVLAPGHNPVEVPDCNHATFGRHIDEVFDATLNTNVFRVFMHSSPDNDRCINVDRQRNEIKSYDKSPDNLLGVSGEWVEYRWKFKLDAGFQPSTSFTHLHQLKAVGGTESSMPQITLTARKSSPNRLELRYAETTSQITLTQVDLAPFEGVWVEAIETVLYGESGKYILTLKRVDDGTVLMSYSDDDIRMWKTQADFIRPKWGIYRSLNDAGSLRDEEVLFANFSIEELPNGPVSIDHLTAQPAIQVYPNPVSDQLILAAETRNLYDTVSLYDLQGKVLIETTDSEESLSLAHLNPGLYLLVFREKGAVIQVEKVEKK